MTGAPPAHVERGRADERTMTLSGGKRGLAAACTALAILSSACASKNDGSSGGGDAGPSTTAGPSTNFGTTAGPADASAPKDGGKLVFGIEAEPEGVDPTR